MENQQNKEKKDINEIYTERFFKLTKLIRIHFILKNAVVIPANNKLTAFNRISGEEQ